MKRVFKKAFAWLLTLAMLVPMFSTVAVPVMAAITSGADFKIETALIEGLMAPSEEPTINTMEDIERESIRAALARNKGSRKLAATELHISERTLYRKIKEYEL